MNTNKLTLAIFLLFFGLASSISAPMSVGLNNQLISGGTLAIDTSSSYGNYTLVWNPMNYTIPYPSTMVVPSAIQVSVTMKTVQVYVSPSGRVSFYPMPSNISQTGFILQSYSSFPGYIQSLTYRYLVLMNTYATTQAAIGNCAIFLNASLSSSQNVVGICPLPQPMGNYNVQDRALSGIDLAKTDSNNIFNIQFGVPTYINSTAIQFVLHSNTATVTTVISMTVSFLFYANSDPLNANFNYYIIAQTFSPPETNYTCAQDIELTSSFGGF